MTVTVPHPQGDRKLGFPPGQPDSHPPGGDLVDVPVHDDIIRLPVETVRQPVAQRVLAPRRIAVSRQLIRSHRDMIPPAAPFAGEHVIQEEHFLRVPLVICLRLADHMSDLRDVFQLVKTGFQQTKLILVFQYDTIKDSHERNSLMRPDIEIRSLQAGDRDGWENLVRDFRAWSGEGPPHSAEVYETTWRRLQEATEIHVLGAWTDRQLIGVAHYFFHPRIWGEKACYLTDLFVEEKMRGHGAGRALIEKVAQVAREHDAARYYWLTLEDNTEARVLYGKIARGTGFIRYQYPL